MQHLMIVPMSSDSRLMFRDLLYVSLLVLYIFAGMVLAPFHGDEATIIYLSKDWYRIVIQHDLSTVFYRSKIDDPRLADEQEFRLQNGVISGVLPAWHVARGRHGAPTFRGSGSDRPGHTRYGRSRRHPQSRP